MKRSLSKLSSYFFGENYTKAQKVLFSIAAVLFFAYALSIPVFSNRYPFNYLSILLCGLMCIMMLVYVFIYGKFKINLLIFVLIGFNIAILVSHILNRSMAELPKTIFLMSVVALVTYQFFSSVEKKNSFITIFLLSGIVFAFIYIIYFREEIFKFNISSSSRLGDFFDNENEIGKELAIFCVTSFAIFLRHKRVAFRVTSAILAVVFFFLVLTTGSISNLLTTIVVCIITAIICQKTTKGKIIIAAVSLGAIGVFALLLQIPNPSIAYFKTRIEKIFLTIFGDGSGETDGSASSRLNAALISFEVALNKICFGFGYMSGTKFNPSNIQAHNNFVELFLDFGVFGLAAFEVIVILPIFYAYRHKDKHYIYALLLYLLVFQLFLTTFYKKVEYLIFAYIYAVMDDVFDVSLVLYDSSWRSKDKTRKVIFEVIPNLTPVGGAETFITDFVIEAKSKYGANTDIYLITLYNQEESILLSRIKESGVHFIELGKNKGLDIICALRFRELVYKIRPDIIHTHLLSLTTLKLALPFKRKKIKIFHTIHHNVTSNNRSQRLLVRLVKSNYLVPICVAETPAEEYKKLFGKDVQFIDNGIDSSNFDNSKPLAERNNDFLIVGRFVEIKNHKLLIKLIVNYFKGENYKFIFLGDGPLLEECKQMSADFKLDKIVSFKGNVTNVNEYMSDSKVLIIPSLNEGNPIVINEAFASGMFVVGNDVGGIRDLLAKTDFNILVDVNNDELFVDALKTCISRSAMKEYQKLSYNLEGFGVKASVAKYFKVFGIE